MITIINIFVQHRRKSSYKHDVANYTENNSYVVHWQALIINNGNEDGLFFWIAMGNKYIQTVLSVIGTIETLKWRRNFLERLEGCCWSSLEWLEFGFNFDIVPKPLHAANGYNFLMSLKGKWLLQWSSWLSHEWKMADEAFSHILLLSNHCSCELCEL